MIKVAGDGVDEYWYDIKRIKQAKDIARQYAQRHEQNAVLYVYNEHKALWRLHGRCVYNCITGEAPYIAESEVSYPWS